MKKAFFGSISAGILISIGGSVFLACENRVVGAVFFAVALLCICYKGYYLFTGKIGYMVESHKKADWQNLGIGLIGNLITTFVLGLVIRYALPNLGETANTICSAKLTQNFLQTLIRSTFCGFLMYLAVSIFRDNKTPLAILYGIPVFILSGFEHSIADMFYFGASGIFDVKAISFFAAVILGNSLGGILLPILQNAAEGKRE